MKIRYKSVMHFILLYLMVCVADTYVYNMYFIRLLPVIAALCLGIVVINKKYQNQYSVLFIIFLLTAVVVSRILSGGVGLQVWYTWTICVLVTCIAICYKKEAFLERYVKIIYFLTIISLFMWIIGLVAPGIVSNLLPSHYASGWTWNEWTGNTSYTAHDYYNNGLFLYVQREYDNRNVSIFTEPGLFQLHLNSALFILLFMQDKMCFSRKQYIRILVVLILGVLSSQSTTGYFGMFMILLVSMMAKESGDSVARKWVFRIVILGVALVAAYSAFWDNNLITNVLFRKLSRSSWLLTNTSTLSTGVYRLNSIVNSLQIMITHPLGIGYDQVQAYADTMNLTTAGAVIFNTGAAIGVLPMIVMIWWVLYPVLRSKMFSASVKWLYVFLYCNTVLTQSAELYPALIMIPLFLRLNKYTAMGERKNES